MLLKVFSVIIAYSIFFLCPLIYLKYEKYDSRRSSQINYLLNNTMIKKELNEDIKDVYLKNTGKIKKHIPKIVSVVAALIGFITPTLYIDTSKEHILAVILGFSIIGLLTLVLGFIAYLFFCDFIPNPKNGLNFKFTTDDLLTVYFEKEYPSLQAFLIPIYKGIKTPNGIAKFEDMNFTSRYISTNEDKYKTTNSLTRFGHYLLQFTLIFETAQLKESSATAFNNEILKPENIELLAKLIVFLDDATLIKQLNNEKDNDIAKLFNDKFEKMLLDLANRLEQTQQKVTKLSELKNELDDVKARERLELLVMQSFNLIK